MKINYLASNKREKEIMKKYNQTNSSIYCLLFLLILNNKKDISHVNQYIY